MRRAAAVIAIGLAALAWGPDALGSPLVGVSANTLPAGEFMIDVWGIWKDYTRSYTQSLYAEGEGGWIGFPENSALQSGSFVPRLYYGITDWLTIRCGVPLEHRYMNFPDADGEKSNTALGDVVVDPKIQIYRGEGGYPRIALLAGVRLGTGDVDGTPACSDGSTDVVVGGVVTHETQALAAHAAVTYWVNGESDDGIDIKNLWVGSATLESSIGDGWSLLWELKGYVGEDPSAYYRLYACPGVCWTGESWTAGMSAMVPFASHGGGGISFVDYDWAPYFRIYRRFF
jgi:hypothetical protein